MNFHPDKQLFQVAGAGDQTTDPWITNPALNLYTMLKNLKSKVLLMFFLIEQLKQFLEMLKLEKKFNVCKLKKKLRLPIFFLFSY